MDIEARPLKKVNKAYQAAYHRSYRAKRNTDPAYLAKRREYTRLHRAKDPGYKERARLYSRSRAARREELVQLRKLAVVNVLTDGEGTCRWCGQGDIDVLCVDHIDNSGAVHRKAQRGLTGDSMYKWLVRNDYPPGYQILCFNCNTKKELLYRRSLREGASCRTITQ